MFIIVIQINCSRFGDICIGNSNGCTNFIDCFRRYMHDLTILILHDYSNICQQRIRLDDNIVTICCYIRNA